LGGKAGKVAKPKPIAELKPWEAKISPEAFVEMQKERILQNIKDAKSGPKKPLKKLVGAELKGTTKQPPLKSARESMRVFEAARKKSVGIRGERESLRQKLELEEALARKGKYAKEHPSDIPIIKGVSPEEAKLIKPAGKDFLEKAQERVGGVAGIKEFAPGREIIKPKKVVWDKKKQKLDIKTETINQLKKKGFYGTIDRLERNMITLDEAKAELAGKKPRVKTPAPPNPADYAAELKAFGVKKQESWSRWVQRTSLRPGMDAKEWYKIYDSVEPQKPKTETTVSFLGTQQAYEKAVKKIQWLKEAGKAFAEGVQDAIDVEAPLKRIGAPKTARAQKLIFSRMAKEEELGLHLAKQNAKLFDYDKTVAPDVVLSYEDPVYYAKRGVRLDFKQRILDELDNLIAEAEKYGIEKPRAKEKLQDLKAARKIAERMNFVHIPTAMWFENFAKDPLGAAKKLKLLGPQKRKSLTINSLIERGLINKEDIHPADIIANYARRKGRDFAILDFVEAARKEGLASKKKQSGMVKIPGYIAPVLSKYWVKKPLADIVYDMTRLGRMSKFEKFVSATKMAQFYNPLFLPMYDVIQQGMLMGASVAKAPKYWKEAVKDVWKKTDEYWRALDNGLASKPFNAPWSEFKESLEFAKMSNPEIAKFVASEVFSPKILKQIYHGSWRLAWELDKTVRMASYRYLLDKGYSPEKAASIAAKYHSDYASVPPATRRALNHVFFTPTFKITMGKLFGRMLKDAMKSVVGKSPSSPEYAKGLLHTLAILEAYDLFMTQGLGFERDQWGRRYVKKNVETEKGKKDLVITWSTPIKSFIEMNKWEFHPLWRSLYDIFWTNKTPSGDEIVNPFDSVGIKTLKRMRFFTKSMLAVLGLMDRDQMDKTAKEKFIRETSRALEIISRPFVFKYMRSPEKKRLAMKMINMNKQYTSMVFRNVMKGKKIKKPK